MLKGEGVESLAQSFFYAGARSVVASLWKVGDEQTTVFMRAFYGSLRDGKSKSEALREAKLSFIRAGKPVSPRHWAAFILLGDADGGITLAKPDPKSHLVMWALMGALMIGVGAIVLVFRRPLKTLIRRP